MLNKRQLLAALALSLLVTAGCDRIKGLLGKGGVNQDSVKAAAAAQARKDSLARAQATRDSLARIRWTACDDSVEKALKHTAAGRKELKGKSKLPAGMLMASVMKACGGAPPPPPAPKPVTAAAPTGTAAPAGAKPGSAAGAPTPAGKPGAPAPAGAKPGAAAAPAAGKPAPATAAAKPTAPSLTPAQLRVARADSIRKVREAAHADSVAKAREKARVDSLARVRADSIRQDSLKLARETEVLRENFAYSGGSRDPFQSLIQRNSSSVEFGDLVLIGIYEDLRSARNSVALLRDKNTGKRYKVHIGERIGSRMTVAQITERDVTFTIQDFGFERQETLSLPKKGEEANQ